MSKTICYFVDKTKTAASQSGQRINARNQKVYEDNMRRLKELDRAYSLRIYDEHRQQLEAEGKLTPEIAARIEEIILKIKSA